MQKDEFSVTLLRRHSEESRRKTGLGVYADNLENILDTASISYDVIEFKMDVKDGVGAFFFRGVFRPFLNVLKHRKDCIYHITDELCGMFTPFIHGKKVLTVHHVVKRGESSVLYRCYWRFTTKIAVANSDIVIAVSPQTRKELISELKAPENKVVTFYSCIRDVYISKNLEREKIVGGIGELIPRKNFTKLIRAFALFSAMRDTQDYRLQICGKGEQYGELMDLVEKLGLKDKVTIVSDLTVDQVVEFYNKIMVLANPSLHEGLGLVTLEAQKCNTPVVCIRGADIPEDVTRYAIFADEDDQDFADKIHKVVVNQKYRNHMIEKGKEYADNFGKDFSENILKLYCGLLKK
ncbi:MAG: glycosyltransferase [Candidatus Methanomethylophilaceae archaeon]|jgi:glycosyltransferase involved in cell wall biosynthesis